VDFVSLLIAFVSLLKGSFLISIIGFFLFFIALFLFNEIKSKFKLTWIKSCCLSIFLLSFIFLLVIYFVPAFVFPKIISVPFNDADLALNSFELIASYFAVIVKLIISAAIFTVLLTALTLIGNIIHDILFSSKKSKKLSKWIRYYIVILVECIIVSFILLFVFPWLLQGLIYLIYFA